jgi:RNA polymerase sigma factor (sigma-70 family)
MAGRLSAGPMALSLPGAAPWTLSRSFVSPRAGLRSPGRSSDGGEAVEGARPAREAEERAPALVAACVRGDAAARDEFVVQYEGLVRFAIHTVLRQRSVVLLREELEDLQQNVLAAFFDRDCRRLQLYEGRNQASFATFVRVCATRQTLDHLRQRRRRPPANEELENAGDRRSELSERPDPSSGPEEAAATRESLSRLREVVKALPAREQLLVRLHFAEGHDVPEVARALGISENATHVLKSRIRAKLREALGAGLPELSARTPEHSAE